MQVTLPEEAEQKAQSDEQFLVDLAGAKYIHSEEASKNPNVYELIAGDRAEEIVNEADHDLRPMHVFGSTEERVYAELCKRYPAPAGATFLLRRKNIKLNVAEWHTHTRYNRRGERYREWKTKTIPFGYVKLRYPLYEEIDNVDALVELSRKNGPIWLHEDKFCRLFHCGTAKAENAEDEGFIVVIPEDLPIVRVNYNPGAFERRDYAVKLKEYQDRTAGALPQPLLNQLMAIMSPGRWPGDHPFEKSDVRGPEFSQTRGWGHQVTVDFSRSKVITMVKLNLRCWDVPWWRREQRVGSYCNTPEFSAFLSEALKHVHGMEKWAADTQADREKDLRCEYDKYVERWKPKNYEGQSGPITWEEYRPDRRKHTDAAEVQWLASWLRREAKALKLKMPRPPVEPISPAELKAQKKGKRRAGQQRVHHPGGVQA